MCRAAAKFLVDVREHRLLNVEAAGLIALRDVVNQEKQDPTKACRLLLEAFERESARGWQRHRDARLNQRRARLVVAA